MREWVGRVDGDGDREEPPSTVDFARPDIFDLTLMGPSPVREGWLFWSATGDWLDDDVTGETINVFDVLSDDEE